MAKDSHLPKVRCESWERDEAVKAATKKGLTASEWIRRVVRAAAKRVLAQG